MSTQFQNLKLVTRIACIINGDQVFGEGRGKWDARTRTSHGVIQFTGQLQNFTAGYGNSWHCKHHYTPMPEETEGTNFFGQVVGAGHTLYVVTRMNFLGGKNTIVVSARVFRPENGVQVMEQTRVGEYTGPLDLVELRPYHEVILPNGPGRAGGSSYREVIAADGTMVQTWYDTEFYFPPQFVLPTPLHISYESDASYNRQTGVFTVSVHPVMTCINMQNAQILNTEVTEAAS